MKKGLRFLAVILPLLTAFHFAPKEVSEENLILKILEEDTSGAVCKVLADPGKYRLQIIYTEIKRDPKNRIHLQTHTYRTGLHEYFYPASMVKLPVAALTLEKLHKLHLDRYPTDKLFLKVMDGKKNSPDPGSIEEIIKKIFVVSNNAAFNDLYDLLGQEYINRRLWEMGYSDARIIQKFASTDSTGHRTSAPVRLLNAEGEVVYSHDSIINPSQWKNTARKNMVGKGYFDDRKIIPGPRDFSYGNYVPLRDLHEMVIAIMYPDLVAGERRFQLDGNDYALLRKYMSMYPREAGVNEWMDSTVYYDSFRKYLLAGNTKGRLDPNIRIYNKVGQAYGFMTDCAYIIDKEHGIEFFVSATLYVNNDEIINDGKYEYETIGFPFLQRLGQDLYNRERAKTEKTLTNKK